MKTKAFIIEKLYKTIKGPYQLLFKTKTKAWDLDIPDLLQYPKESLGFALGHFLDANHFDIQPTLEEHDVFHVLTRTGTTVRDEIDMQFYLLGNGKRSVFTFIVIGTGLAFYPFSYKSFYGKFKKGRRAHRFFHLDFLRLLPQPLAQIQYSFNIG